MEVKCCFRLIPWGEVIHSIMDSNTKIIDDMPIDFIDTRNLNTSIYAESNYLNCETDFDKACESILLSNENHCLVIENNNMYYDVLCWNGDCKYMTAATDNTSKIQPAIIPNKGMYIPIGYRATKPIQYRSLDTIYRLTMSKDGSKIITNDGILKPEFDTSKITRLSKTYEGYKEAVNKGYYGVIYFNGEPRFVQKEKGSLILI